MKIMLDCSPKKIHEYRDRYGVDFWQLRTPLTQYDHMLENVLEAIQGTREETQLLLSV